MPNRIVREGILTSSKLARLGWPEEVFYRRLLSVVDDFGRYYADAGMLRAACYPRQLNKVSDSDVGKWLRACGDAALVRVYPAVDGESYLEVVKFDQQVRAKKSRFPAPDNTCVADATQTQSNAHLDVDVFEGVDVGVSAPASKRAKAKGVTLREWLADLGDEDAIPAADPIFEWGEAQGIPAEWLALAWFAFENRYLDDAKTYTDWRAVFRRALRDDWLRLWRHGRSGWELTTAGVQAEREAANAR